MPDLFNQKIVILRAPSLRATRDPFDGPGAPGLESAAQSIAERAVGMTVETIDNPSSSAINALRNDPTVLSIPPTMPMKLIEPLKADAAPAAAVTWGVKAVGADTSPFTGAGVTVSVLDTGIDAAHPAFAGVNLVTKDFTGAGSADDDNGHGTHCAGTIFGRDLNGQRIVDPCRHLDRPRRLPRQRPAFRTAGQPSQCTRLRRADHNRRRSRWQRKRTYRQSRVRN